MGLSNYVPNSRVSQAGVCTSTTRPATPYEGQVIYETDTNRVLVWDASAWVMIADTDQPPGLQLVAKGTLSLGTTYQNVVGCFNNDDFANYRILLDVTAVTTSSRLEFRLLDNTTQAQTLYYNGGIGSNYAVDATVYMQRSSADTRLFLGDANNAIRHVVMDIFHPDQALATTWTGQYLQWSNGFGYSFGGGHNVNTAYDGFALVATAATMTVQYQVFGYRN